MRALERANQVRLARAALKRLVTIGEIEAVDVILDCPWEAQSMPVADLLMSQRRWGQTRCHKILAQLPVSENKTLGSMTDRQCRALAAILGKPEGTQQGASPTPPDGLSSSTPTEQPCEDELARAQP
jgi:hypothetical protein